ncbi:MAG: single-stranded-DNA-specific exonuclease RecJ [Solirubrobacterales bacterium]|nr:single-stranded-DNA-specific exonuclease RecJ [Solirubrobacterales bacterium]
MPQAARQAFTLEPYDYSEARALMAALGLAEPVAVTLVRRGYRTAEQARAFLEAADDHDPFLFEAMAEVAERIRAAVGAGRRITVHGDYDVDGVCSTAILVRTLRELGGECDWLIPGRLEDGYGLTAATVARLAARGTSLLITTDCGIGSAAEVEVALAAGLEVIVTDHHQPGGRLPRCPILHPQVSGYPFADLCATGVAYKLAAALRGAEAVETELDLVALATVADLVPLRGENRALVRRGLAEARRVRRPGLRALMASAGVVAERLDEGDFAFRLGPRINAAGRLYRADAGVELMLTGDQARAFEIAAELERANRERREVEFEVLASAERARAALSDGLAEAPGLVLAGEGWHPGVVGIVASRLVERHFRPTVLIGLDGDGRGRGSARSVPGFDLLAALDDCAEHLVRHGGHRAAAGLEIEGERIEAFRAAFAERVGETLPESARIRTEVVDAVVGGESLGHEVASQLARLAPFGLGNPAVRLLVPGASVGDVRPMGDRGRHARFSLRSGNRRARGVAFGTNGELDSAARAGPLDVSVKLELNEWNGAVEPRVVLEHLYPPPTAQPAAPGGSPDDRSASAAAEQAAGIGAEEFWRRLDAELQSGLAWPPPVPAAVGRRERIDRRGASGVAAIAALVSSGEAVLAVCADAIRRRQLVERAVRPARLGGGEVALVSARLPEALTAVAAARVREAGAGVVLSDWAALSREPSLVLGFEHLVVVDPPPFAHLDELCAAGSGYLHRVDGPREAEFSLRVHAEDWPSRASLATLYRMLRGRAGVEGNVGAESARALLCCEDRSHPLSPEAAARSARVLAELGLVRWERFGDARALGVVSSEGTELERSVAFVAYRDRHEEGWRYLSKRRQTPG